MSSVQKTPPLSPSLAPALPSDLNLKPAKHDVQEGSSKVSNAVGNVGSDTKPEAEELKEKSKETAQAAKDLLAQTGDSVRANAGQAAEGAKQVGSGLLSAISKPATWVGNKIAGAASNVVTPRPNERFSPLWGAALLAGGTALFAAATAASWSATLFVTAPALGAGLATLGLAHLAWSIGARIFAGAPAPSSTVGHVDGTSVAHRTGIAINSTIESNAEVLRKDLASLDKKKLKLQSTLKGTNDKLADVITQQKKLEIELAQTLAYTVAPVAAAEITPARAADNADQPAVVGPEIAAVTTTEQTTQNNETSVTASVGHQDVSVDKSLN